MIGPRLVRRADEPQQGETEDAMGLDMYLKAHKFLTKRDDGGASFDAVVDGAGLPKELVAKDAPFLTVEVTVGYWRKANAVHVWFVGLNGGVDECKDQDVSREHLATLRDLCKRVLVSRDATDLPPSSGFFFGSTQVDDYYWQDMEATVAIVEKALSAPKDWYFIYRASW